MIILVQKTDLGLWNFSRYIGYSDDWRFCLALSAHAWEIFRDS